MPVQANDTRTWLRMGQLVLIANAVCAGMLNSLQFALLGGITRERGAWEATWISMLGSPAGMAISLSILVFAGSSLDLATPFRSPWLYVACSTIMAISLVVAGCGPPSYLLVTGLTSIPYLLVASIIGPRLGLAVFFASIVSGQLIGTVTLDHMGAFGSTPRPIDLTRAFGIASLLVGVILIRGRN